MLTAALTEGPYFVDEKLLRSDIRADPVTGAVSQGVPLSLQFNVQRVSNSACTPLTGAYLDVWHCDAAGVYSDVTAAGNAGGGRKFLRGYQITDADGIARFQTIHPGWYSGRGEQPCGLGGVFGGGGESMPIRSVLRHARVLAAATLLAGLSAAPAAPGAPTAPAADTLLRMAPAGAPAVDVTLADVRASNAKAAMAYASLVPMWRAHFADVGARFVAPQVARFRGAGVRTPCGAVAAGNAAYCPRDNVIYFDEIFLAAQAKRAARELGTDGDMAAVGVIAHEMGHAVAIQLGHMSRFTYENESTADCLAGAFARQAEAAGELEPGDIDEAFFGMAAAGDPTPQLTGDRRADRAILVRAVLMGHGTDEQRTANFQAGLERGPGACLPEFRGG